MRPLKGFGLSNTDSGFVLVVVKNYINISCFFFFFKLQSTEGSVAGEDLALLLISCYRCFFQRKLINKMLTISAKFCIFLGNCCLQSVELFYTTPSCQETIEVRFFFFFHTKFSRSLWAIPVPKLRTAVQLGRTARPEKGRFLKSHSKLSFLMLKTTAIV